MFKLVRDKIPQISKQPERFTQLVLDQDEENIAELLHEKFEEEMIEFYGALGCEIPLEAIEEAGDVVEVLMSIIAHGYGMKRDHVFDVLKLVIEKKYEERGGFEEHHIMNLDSKSVYKPS